MTYPVERSAAARSAIVAFATPSAAAAAFSDSFDRTGSTATPSPLGSEMTSVLKTWSGSRPRYAASSVTASSPNESLRGSCLYWSTS